MANETLFPELERWMIRNPDAARELSTSTRDRYLKGGIPTPLLWFIRHSGALKALARDANDLGLEDVNEMRAQAEARSTKQRRYRAKSAGEFSNDEASPEAKPGSRKKEQAA